MMLSAFFILIISFEVTQSSHFQVNTLPGFAGDLPFTLETGYIGVGENDEIQLFYLFVESEGNPREDPLILWLTGGPGCSGLSTFVYETGPIAVNYADSNFEKIVLEMNPNRWTKVSSMIFIDQPIGTGYSYAKTPEAYITNDTLSAFHAYTFVKKWLMDHPKFLNNPFYVSGESYAGIMLPVLVEKIYNGNEVGEEPRINIKGYLLGNPFTNMIKDKNSRIEYANHMALLSDEIYKSVKENCKGEYMKVNPDNNLCLHDLEVVDKTHIHEMQLPDPSLKLCVYNRPSITKCLRRIYRSHILYPYSEEKSRPFKSDDLYRRGLGTLSQIYMPQVQKQSYSLDYLLYSYVWANSINVREALHVRKEFGDTEWLRCNDSISFRVDSMNSISYTNDVTSAVGYHKRLANKYCRALIYSGDHDMEVPYLSTMNWIESLNLSVVDDWRPWFVDEQVAGYTMKYFKDDYGLRFATVKGAGHVTSLYKPKECLHMFMRWLSENNL